MYTSPHFLEPDYVGSLDNVAGAPNLGLMVGAAILAFVVATSAVPGLFAGLDAVASGRRLWPVVGLLVWLGALVLAIHLGRSYGDQVEQAPFALLTTFGNGVAGAFQSPNTASSFGVISASVVSPATRIVTLSGRR